MRWIAHKNEIQAFKRTGKSSDFDAHLPHPQSGEVTKSYCGLMALEPARAWQEAPKGMRPCRKCVTIAREAGIEVDDDVEEYLRSLRSR